MLKKVAFGLCLLLFFAVIAASGAPVAPVPVQTVVTVEARHEKAEAPSLNAGDVMVYEHRERLPVTSLVPLTAEHAGLELFVLIDDSSDTAVGSQFPDVRRFIEAQPGATAIGIGYMRNGMVDIVQTFTTDHSRAANALRVPLAAAGASPYLSLSDLIKRWSGLAGVSDTRRAVVMVSSGIDPLGGLGPMNPYLDTAIDDAQRAGVIVYAIYMPAAGHSGHSIFRMNWGQSYLAELAEQTGGEAYMLGFGRPVSFAPYLDEIAGHLAHQYRVTFLVTPANKAEFKEVRFTTEVPDAELVAAAKVWVPAAAK